MDVGIRIEYRIILIVRCMVVIEIEQREFCKKLQEYIRDENNDFLKYNEFAEHVQGMGMPVVVQTALNIGIQEMTHRDWWQSIYNKYCHTVGIKE